MDYLTITLIAIILSAQDVISQSPEQSRLQGWWLSKDSEQYPLWAQILWPFRDGWHTLRFVSLVLLVVVWPLVANISVVSLIWYALIYAVVFEVGHTWV